MILFIHFVDKVECKLLGVSLSAMRKSGQSEVLYRELEMHNVNIISDSQVKSNEVVFSFYRKCTPKVGIERMSLSDINIRCGKYSREMTGLSNLNVLSNANNNRSVM